MNRIIPARAGFTGRHARFRGGTGDHPRSRGVYPSSERSEEEEEGSSPLARGLRADLDVQAIAQRIIPARAGFTASARPGPRGRWDHPRLRGVYESEGDGIAPVHGSSPLARGLLKRPSSRTSTGGIIPARAGFTPPANCAAAQRRDHPRSRGVY